MISHLCIKVKEVDMQKSAQNLNLIKLNSSVRTMTILELISKNHDYTYTCKTCNKIVKHRHNIKGHLKVFQNKASSCKNEIKCLECGKTFSCNSKLKTHKKVLNCKNCERNFKRQDLIILTTSVLRLILFQHLCQYKTL